MSTPSGLSVWWSTPANPHRFFSSDDLDRSDRYHRPIRRMAVGALVTKMALLLGASWLAGGPLQRAALPGSTDEMGLGGWLTSGPVLVGAALTTVALRVPAIAVDAWFEYRFRHGERPLQGHVPGVVQQAESRFVAAPIAWFSATVVAITAGVWVTLVLLGGIGYRLVTQGGDWSMRLSVAVLAILVGAAVLERPFRHRVSRRERPLEDGEGDSGAAGLDRLAASFGLTGLGLYATDVGTASGTHKRPGGAVSGTERSGVDVMGSSVPNACAVGLGPNRRVVMTEALLQEHTRVREFVVAHEFTHLARRHLLVQSAVAAAVYLLSIQLLSVLAKSGRPWSWFGLETTDPLGLPVVALVLFLLAGVGAPLVAWLTRAQERIADAGAISVLGPLPGELALKLHGRTAADLDPPWWVRLYDQHPAPAERLEFLARHR